MNNLEKYFAALPLETVFMYFFSHGCEECPAKEYCDQQGDDTCCHQNFTAWAKTESGEVAKMVVDLRRMADNSRSKHDFLTEVAETLAYATVETGVSHEQIKAQFTQIHNLRSERDRLQAELEELRGCKDIADDANCRFAQELMKCRAKLDAAIQDLHGECSACKNYTVNHNEGLCRFCCFEKCRSADAEINDNWQWRREEKS